MDIDPHEFPDHHRFTAGDFKGMDGMPIVMTEKDAVKCTELPLEDAWYAIADAELDGGFDENLIELLKP
jgi:tetraacyldisaccharide 4'-kinase